MNLESMIKKTSESEWELSCPECGFDYVHIATLSCLRFSDKTTISKDGIFVKQAQNDMRGFKITLEYCCENGHAGNIILQFHEGHVYLAHEVLPVTNTATDDIWRD